MAVHFSEHPILTDFDRFISYICNRPSLQLTIEKALLKGPDLLALNAQMTTFQSPMVTNKNHQMAFTLPNAFFFIAQKLNMIYAVQNDKNGKNHLAFREDSIRKYDALSDDEKYFTLLEGFWCHVDWDDAFDCRSFWSKDFYMKLAGMPIGKKITLSDINLKRAGEIEAPAYSFFGEMLAAFGLWTLTWDDNLVKRPAKYEFAYKDITLTHLGSVMIPILFIDRPKYKWSKLQTRDFFDDEEDDDEDDQFTPKGNFEDAFIPFFEGLTIEKHLFKREKTLVAGTYYFKVALDKKLYRVIAIDGKATFDAFHDAIQDAFDLDDDHLYAFFMDGRPWSQSGNVFWSPNNDEGIRADTVHIGEAHLHEGKAFLYLFDFGSEWHFKVTVRAINTEEQPPKKHKIIESVGESPNEYGDEDY